MEAFSDKTSVTTHDLCSVCCAREACQKLLHIPGTTPVLMRSTHFLVLSHRRLIREACRSHHVSVSAAWPAAWRGCFSGAKICTAKISCCGVNVQLKNKKHVKTLVRISRGRSVGTDFSTSSPSLTKLGLPINLHAFPALLPRYFFPLPP